MASGQGISLALEANRATSPRPPLLRQAISSEAGSADNAVLNIGRPRAVLLNGLAFICGGVGHLKPFSNSPSFPSNAVA